MPGFDVAVWHMIVAPAATPKPIVHKLNADLGAILKEPAAAQEMTRRGFVPPASASSPENSPPS